MYQERMDLLCAIYTSAKNFDNMDEPYLMTNVDGTIDNQFNLQYMESKELINIQHENGKCYAVITSAGVDMVEDYLDSVEGFEKLDLNNTIANLLLDKIDRKMGQC